MESVVTNSNLPCDKCGSSDALAEYSDGHTYCFACEDHTSDGGGELVTPVKKRVNPSLLLGTVKDIPNRKLQKKTCAKWGYRVGKLRGVSCHIAPYFNSEGVEVAQKIRMKGKKFTWLGDVHNVTLFGQQIPYGSKNILVITEGEIDALSVSQVNDLKWPVVSVPNGATGAAKDVSKNLEWVSSFEKVVILFDNDIPGRKAAKEVAEILPVGKAFIGRLPDPHKDASDALVAGDHADIKGLPWSAKPYRPDGILGSEDMWESMINNDRAESISYPWDGLNDKLDGLRLGEIVTFCAGSGVGKSQFSKEILHHLISSGKVVGGIFLEESIQRTLMGLIGISLNEIVQHVDADDKKIRKAYDSLTSSDQLFLYDHFGSIGIPSLISKIRFLNKHCGVQYVILDHISIVISGISDGDERRLIDNFMTELRSLVEELGICLLCVSHLKRPFKGKGHEEGAATSLSQLRGSASIAQLSDIVIGLERNQQGDTPDITQMRVLKNRYNGSTGLAGQVEYSHDTGRLVSCSTLTTINPNEEFEEL